MLRGAAVMAAALACVAALAAAPAAVLAWGPVSHAVFMCAAHSPDDVAGCLRGQPGLVIGSDLPDAFAFGALNISGSALPPDAGGSACQGLVYVHDPVFAVFLARSMADAPAAQRAVARGFGTHIMGDLVGFRPQLGLLCSPLVGECSTAGINYAPLWSLMLAYDAYYAATYAPGLDVARELPLPEAHVTPAFAAAFANATEQYHRAVPTFAPVSAHQVLSCARFWQTNTRSFYGVAAAQTRASAVAFVRTQLVYFNQRFSHDDGDEGWQAIRKWAAQQVDCASHAVKAFWAGVDDGDKQPGQVIGEIVGMVNSWYEQGVCSPPPASAAAPAAWYSGGVDVFATLPK